MKRKPVSHFRRVLAVLCIALLSSSFFVYAAAEKLTLKETKTDIQAISVYNCSGYGTVSYEAPVQEEGGSFDWYWYGLLGPDRKSVV